MTAVEFAVDGCRVDCRHLRLRALALGFTYVEAHHISAAGALLGPRRVQVGYLRVQGRAHDTCPHAQARQREFEGGGRAGGAGWGRDGRGGGRLEVGVGREGAARWYAAGEMDRGL